MFSLATLHADVINCSKKFLFSDLREKKGGKNKELCCTHGAEQSDMSRFEPSQRREGGLFSSLTMNRFVCKFSEVAVTLDDRQNSLGFTGRHVLWQTRSPSIVNVSREFNSRTLGYFMTSLFCPPLRAFCHSSVFPLFPSSLSDIRDFSFWYSIRFWYKPMVRVRACMWIENFSHQGIIDEGNS